MRKKNNGDTTGTETIQDNVLHDPEGNEILEIKGIETDDYILIPKKTLRQILKEATL